MATEKKTYTIPYRSQLQEKFEPGQTLICKGSSIPESQRFSLNFHHKSADFSGNDIPLHIAVRFDEGKIILNSFSDGQWGKEQRKSSPIKRGEPFDVRVRAHDDRFQVIIDHKEFCEYEHRLPLSNVTHFSVDGDIYLNQVSWGGKYYSVPYESGIATGFPVGKRLLIQGSVEKKAKRFHVNLLRKNGDIALHFNPRFDEKHVIRNSLQAAEWQNEEREGKMPFEKGHGFDLVIVNEDTHFDIVINEQPFATFAHRSDPNDISGLQIAGDIELSGIQIH
ncbi:hypothetical protein M3Y94_00577400 [Aphelenchoides besseyi]|nr:hypothetical protein M3Y94_00577400 [Aphelenchoides besseyi]KAI6221992.1 Galectin [Aphelenchoides besseyi]